MPKRERDEPIGLAALLRDDGAGGCAVQKLDRRELLERVERALQSNADDSLSVLLHVLEQRDEWAWLQDEQRVKPLVELAVEAQAVECLLMLLNAVRKAEELLNATRAAEEGGPRPSCPRARAPLRASPRAPRAPRPASPRLALSLAPRPPLGPSVVSSILFSSAVL